MRNGLPPVLLPLRMYTIMGGYIYRGRYQTGQHVGTWSGIVGGGALVFLTV